MRRLSSATAAASYAGGLLLCRGCSLIIRLTSHSATSSQRQALRFVTPENQKDQQDLSEQGDLEETTLGNGPMRTHFQAAPLILVLCA